MRVSAVKAALLGLLGALAAALCVAPREAWLIATWLGGSPAYMLIAPIAFHLLGGRRGYPAIAALALSAGLASTLKHLLGLPRPPPGEWLAEAEGPGFPSGHAAVAAGFWAALAMAKPEPWLAALAVAASGLVAASRLALGVHYPWDAAGGIALGLAAAAAATALAGRLPPHKGLASAGILGLAVEAPTGFRDPEAPIVALGASLGAVIAGRRSPGLEPAGARGGLLASLAAAALGAPSKVAPDPLGLPLLFAAGLAAVAAPYLAKPRQQRVPTQRGSHGNQDGAAEPRGGQVGGAAARAGGGSL